MLRLICYMKSVYLPNKTRHNNCMKPTKKHLWLAICIYALGFSAISIYKYMHLGYNGLDLAIFTNVLENVVSGNGFWSSIQGHHYFADHFTPLLVLLLPLYYIWHSPLLLLIIQSIILALTAWPVFLLAKKIINEKWGVLLALLWLINPLLWNVNIHEWHVIPWAIPLLLFAYYYYLAKDYKKFLIFILLSLLIREDVVVVTAMFSLLALVEKRNWKWIVSPGLLATAYFAFTMWLVSSLRPGGSRFFIYYDWILTAKPLDWLAHLAGIASVEMLVGLSLAFLLLPWLKPKYLLLSLGVFLQFALTSGGGGNIATDTHYASLFLPGLIIASLHGLNKLTHTSNKLTRFLTFDARITKVGIGLCLVYLLCVLGPGYGIIMQLVHPYQAKAEKQIINSLKNQKNIAASYRYLPDFSNHEQLYPLHYILLGYQQYSSEPYIFQKPDAILLDLRDLTMYELQFLHSRYARNHYPKGYANLDKLINNGYKLETFGKNTLVWTTSNKTAGFENPYSKNELRVTQTTPINLGPLTLLEYETGPLLSIAWETSTELNDNLFLKISTDTDTYIRPVSLFHPTSEWQINTVYETTAWLPPDTTDVTIALIKITGAIELDYWRGIKQTTHPEPVSDMLTLTQ